jgi:NTP pyrophosphatase (non-canonical NTP hydrolase)
MKLPEFFPYVDRLFVKRRHGLEGTLHAAIGLAGEGGEVLDLVKKTWVSGKELDLVKLQTEAGDTLHYLVMLCIKQGWTLEDLAANNKAKLDKRYPDGCSDAANIARADVVLAFPYTSDDLQELA